MMKYKSYYGRVDYDDEAKIFHGELVGIRAVITFQGATVEELEEAFKDSMGLPSKVHSHIFCLLSEKNRKFANLLYLGIYRFSNFRFFLENHCEICRKRLSRAGPQLMTILSGAKKGESRPKSHFQEN